MTPGIPSTPGSPFSPCRPSGPRAPVTPVAPFVCVCLRVYVHKRKTWKNDAAGDQEINHISGRIMYRTDVYVYVYIYVSSCDCVRVFPCLQLGESTWNSTNYSSSAAGLGAVVDLHNRCVLAQAH